MGGGEVALLVGGLVALQLAIWVPLLLWVRSRSAGMVSRMQAELERSGEQVLRGPERALYRGASAGHTRVKGNGVLVLTRSRLLFHKLVGSTPIEVLVTELVGVRQDKWFLGAYRGGHLHVIAKLVDGSEIGFIVKDPDAWASCLEEVCRT